MSFKDVMQIMLPQQNGTSPHVTGGYGEPRSNGPHGGTDLNYQGGQTGINLTHPEIYAPISGTIEMLVNGERYVPHSSLPIYKTRYILQ